MGSASLRLIDWHAISLTSFVPRQPLYRTMVFSSLSSNCGLDLYRYGQGKRIDRPLLCSFCCCAEALQPLIQYSSVRLRCKRIVFSLPHSWYLNVAAIVTQLQHRLPNMTNAAAEITAVNSVVLWCGILDIAGGGGQLLSA